MEQMDWFTGGRQTPGDQDEASFRLEFDDTEVRCKQPSGEVEKIAWDDLQRVLL